MVTGTRFHHPYQSALLCLDMQQPDTHEIGKRHSRKPPSTSLPNFPFRTSSCAATPVSDYTREGWYRESAKHSDAGNAASAAGNDNGTIRKRPAGSTTGAHEHKQGVPGNHQHFVQCADGRESRAWNHSCPGRCSPDQIARTSSNSKAGNPVGAANSYPILIFLRGQGSWSGDFSGLWWNFWFRVTQYYEFIFTIDQLK